MSIISKVVEKKQEAWRLPERELGTDLGRLTVLERQVTRALEDWRDPLVKAEGVAQNRRLLRSHFQAITGQETSGVFRMPERVRLNRNASAAARLE
jgi:hypothetical protein